MFRLLAIALTVSLCLGMSAGRSLSQAPAPGPSAGGSSLASQLAASPTFAYLKCDDALDNIYTAYQTAKSFSKVPALSFNTSLYYVYCSTLDTTGNALLVYHPIITPVGLASTAYTAAPLLPGATTAMSLAGSAVLADNELFYTSYPWNAGGKAPAAYTKEIIGRVIGGVGDDAGKNFVCGCGVAQSSATARR